MREIRRVPADWLHPINAAGRPIPLAGPDALPRPGAQLMPVWPEAERTHWQLYETTTAGTPLSPPMPTAEALAGWLACHHVEAAPGFKGTARQWLALIQSGRPIPTVVMDGRRPVSPFEGLPP